MMRYCVWLRGVWISWICMDFSEQLLVTNCHPSSCGITPLHTPLQKTAEGGPVIKLPFAIYFNNIPFSNVWQIKTKIITTFSTICKLILWRNMYCPCLLESVFFLAVENWCYISITRPFYLLSSGVWEATYGCHWLGKDFIECWFGVANYTLFWVTFFYAIHNLLM